MEKNQANKDPVIEPENVVLPDADKLENQQATVNNADERPRVREETQQEKEQREKVTEFIISRLLSGESYRTVADQIDGMSKTTLHKLFPKNYIDQLRREQMQAQEPYTPLVAAPLAAPQLSQVPTDSGHVIVPVTWFDQYQQNLTPTQRRNFQLFRWNVLTYNQQLEEKARTQQQVIGPRATGSYGHGEDLFYQELAKSEKLDRALRMRRGFKGADRNDGVQTVLKAIQMGVQLVPKQQNQNPIDIYRSGRGDEAKTQSQISGSSKTEIDLKIEEMRQLHDIDMAKLAWEQKLYFLKLQGDKDKWSALTEAFIEPLKQSGPAIQETMQGLGRAAVRAVGGLNTQTQPDQEVTSFNCPNCKTELNVPKAALRPGIPIKCPKCQELFPGVPEEKTEPPKITPSTDRARMRDVTAPRVEQIRPKWT